MGKTPLRKVTAESKRSTMRRFMLNRLQDETGTSGTGIVAEGVEFSNGSVALHWTGQIQSVTLYDNMTSVDKVHGHGGKTEIVWVDK